MSREKEFAKELIDFIYDSPTAFHAVESAKDLLHKQGFTELKEEDSWSLEKGGKYYVTKNDSALTAFVVGAGKIEEHGFKIIGAHTDSPCFRIKPAAEMTVENHYIKLNTETYSGPILSTWMDRPLSVAGRVTLRGGDLFNPITKLVNIKKPILIIPNLAIHMNRNMNQGVELNKQKDMLPLLGLINENLEKGNYLIATIAKEINVEFKQILDFDLFLYEYEKGTIMGLNDEFISSPRLDDLAMVHAGVTAIAKSKAANSTNVMVCFDNEDIGSSSKQGADSPLLSGILERIILAMGGDRQNYFRAIAKSFMISADMTHAVHPNVGEKHDPQNRPLINKGPVIKISANMKYTTDSNSAAVYADICKQAEVPVQYFVNRSDEAGGSTIGPITAAHINIRSVDIGNPSLAMHSVRELAGVMDHSYVTKSFIEFFSLS
ncbi:MAG TPA: M18 family aminopeptidase [Patescibacteria group bacterium]|nr:M18 family aminopeptidase [Patescibacteria group bacterium]